MYWSAVRTFGLTSVRINKSPQECHPELGGHAFLHPELPGLFVGGVYLSKQNYEMFASKETIDFPNLCCGCGIETTNRLPSLGVRDRWFAKRPLLRDVPTCVECAAKRKYSPIVAIIDFRSFIFRGFNGEGEGRTGDMTFLARSRAFLDATARKNAEGDVLPPWFWYSNCDPSEFGGLRENSVVATWWNYIEGCDNERRRAYLQRWNAPDRWLSAVRDNYST